MPTSMGLPWLSLGPLVSGVASCGDTSRTVVSRISFCRYINHQHSSEYERWRHGRAALGTTLGRCVSLCYQLLGFKLLSFVTCWSPQGTTSSSSSSSHKGPSCMSSGNRSSAIASCELSVFDLRSQDDSTTASLALESRGWVEWYFLAPMWMRNSQRDRSRARQGYSTWRPCHAPKACKGQTKDAYVTRLHKIC